MSDFEDALEHVEEEHQQELANRKMYDLQAALKRRERAASDLKSALEASKEELEKALTELSLYKGDYNERPQWLVRKPARSKAHRGSLVAFLSDTHYGEVVRPEELGGYNKYNMAIAEMRTQRFFDNTLMLSRNYLAGVRYDGIVLALGGDLVSGDIHDELIETNEVSTYRAVEMCIPWLARGIEMFLEEFKKVHIVSAPGNHGRNTSKPRHKKKSENNADTHIAKILAGVAFKERPDGLTFDIPEGADVDFDVYGHVFSMEHGDNLKFNGSSEIGSLGPVKRGNLRKTKKRQEQGRAFKYGMYGHFHQYVPAYSQGFIMNGSLKGYDEYASDGQFSPEPAQQALMVVIPEHGVTQNTPIIVSNRDKEGW